MCRFRMMLRFLGLCVFLTTGANASAAELYRWVDKDGKVHYSQTRPAEAPTTQTKIKVPDTKAGSDGDGMPPGDRDEHGNCVSIKCMADQMEADRLERERGYARQKAENERAAKVPPSVSKPSSPPNPRDELLREQCRSGIHYGGNSHPNCDDTATLEKEYSKWQKSNKEGYDEYQRRKAVNPELFR